MSYLGFLCGPKTRLTFFLKNPIILLAVRFQRKVALRHPLFLSFATKLYFADFLEVSKGFPKPFRSSWLFSSGADLLPNSV